MARRAAEHVGRRACRAVLQRFRRSDVLLRWANDGIDALSALYGHAGDVPATPDNLGQQTCLDFLESCYLGMGQPDAERARFF